MKDFIEEEFGSEDIVAFVNILALKLTKNEFLNLQFLLDSCPDNLYEAVSEKAMELAPELFVSGEDKK